MLAQDYEALENLLIRVKQPIHAANLYDSDSVMTCNTAIPYVSNDPKKIHISSTICNECTSIYYDDKDDVLEMLFQTVYSKFC